MNEGQVTCINRNLNYGELIDHYNNTPLTASCRFGIIMPSCLTLSLPVLHFCDSFDESLKKTQKANLLLVLRGIYQYNVNQVEDPCDHM